MEMPTCDFCGFQCRVAWTGFPCPQCGKRTPVALGEFVAAFDAGMIGQPVTLNDIPLTPIAGVRTGTGLDVITAESAGVPQSAVVLLWGVEGSGKSRLALCAMDEWCGSVRPVGVSPGFGVYILRESMSLTQLRRIAHEHDCRRLDSIAPQKIDGDEPVTLTRRGRGPHCFVIDSAADTETVLAAKHHVEHHPHDTVIVIAQATKDGQFLGERAMAHEADVEIEIQALPNEHRRLIIGKNRFGSAGVFDCPWPPRTPV